MANDRIMLKCKKCSARKMLYKYYPDTPNVVGPYPIREDLADYIYNHIKVCFNLNHAPDLDGEECFSIETE